MRSHGRLVSMGPERRQLQQAAWYEQGPMSGYRQINANDSK